jgi:5-methylcytosine-specific restriction endonuclease McrA
MITTAREQTVRLADLLRREHCAMAELLVALADFDRRRLWEEMGHSSLFYFLHRELGLPKGPAFYRKTAAELIQRYPEIVEPLRDGRLCLTSVVELSKVITPENRAEVLPRFFHLSKLEAKAITAALQPEDAPPLREVVTVVRAHAAAPSATLALPVAGPTPCAPPLVLPEEPARANAGVPDVSCAPPPASRPVGIEPLTADLRRLHLTVSRRLLDKLEAARAVLSHSHPGAGMDEILEAGLDLLLERAAKRKGLVRKPRTATRQPASDAIPASVKREVWKRAGGCCEWPVEGGGVCGSTLRLEFDHVRPRALGGPSTFENIRLHCRAHNQLAARRVFGEKWMGQFSGCARACRG